MERVTAHGWTSPHRDCCNLEAKEGEGRRSQCSSCNSLALMGGVEMRELVPLCSVNWECVRFLNFSSVLEKKPNREEQKSRP